MTTEQFNAKINQLGLSHAKLADIFLLGGTELIEHWAAGQERVPDYVGKVLATIEEQRAWLLT